MQESLENIKIQSLPDFSDTGIPVDLLRLDLFHPVVSGNKWFKLRYHLEEVIRQSKTSIGTFGGAWSNHIVATAYAAQQTGIPSIGLIRGDDTATPSQTLQDARNYGMELVFIDRTRYRDKSALIQQWDAPGRHWIPEGGYGPEGTSGAGTILSLFDMQPYTHIICAVGTGTMMAGLINKAESHQEIVGIPVLKNQAAKEEIDFLLDRPVARYSLHPAYHFGGYAKQTDELIDFINDLWATQLIPTDIVYTSKLLFGVKDLLAKGYFPANSRLLVIHSGGLQGNRSLQPGTLSF